MSYQPKRFPPQIEAQLQAALHKAALHPERRSEILGRTALGLHAASEHPDHLQHAPVLRVLAERVAEAALAAQQPALSPATLDDFQETLEEYNTAHSQFSGDQDVLARADDLHDEKTAQRGARVSIAPLSWGKGATLGRSGRFKWNPSGDEVNENVAQAATLAYWMGEPHEACAVTVDVALTSAPQIVEPGSVVGIIGTPDTSARSYAIVSYGSDGAITSVKLDVGFGMRLTVVGSYVSVVVGMDPPKTDAVAGTMSFCASIGAFAAPSVAPVFVTEYVDGLAATATSSLIQRPQHATHILPLLTSSAVGGFALLQFFGMGAGGSAGTPLYGFNYNLAQLQNPIPLPAQVQYIALQNNTAQQNDFAIPFQLSL